MIAIGRAGLFAGAPLRVLKFKGDQRLSLLDIPAGHLRGKAGIAFKNRKANPETNWPTCPRLPAPGRKTELNPEKGQHRRG
jgi:hypothetical protein